MYSSFIRERGRGGRGFGAQQPHKRQVAHLSGPGWAGGTGPIARPGEAAVLVFQRGFSAAAQLPCVSAAWLSIWRR